MFPSFRIPSPAGRKGVPGRFVMGEIPPLGSRNRLNVYAFRLYRSIDRLQLIHHHSL
ncbi:hypothetical protein ACLMAB_09590 [Brevibacillus laterosporus]